MSSRVVRRSQAVVLGGVVTLLLASCAWRPIPGGAVVRDYRPQVVVAYEAEGDVAPGTRYFLVQQGPALAFFEETGAGSGTVLERHWTDAAGDHFAVWAPPDENAPALEVVVPLDRTQPAYRFVYEPGIYEVRNEGGQGRPVPRMLIEASAQLRPVRPR